MKNHRADKITLLREILVGKKSIRDLREGKILIVRETSAGNYCDTDGKEWSQLEIDSHKLKNRSHSFFCFSSFHFDNTGIHSKTGLIKW